jgi:hypothetical protein
MQLRRRRRGLVLHVFRTGRDRSRGCSHGMIAHQTPDLYSQLCLLLVIPLMPMLTLCAGGARYASLEVSLSTMPSKSSSTEDASSIEDSFALSVPEDDDDDSDPLECCSDGRFQRPLTSS